MRLNNTMAQLRMELDDANRAYERARDTAEYWKSEHLAANAEIERLRAALREVEALVRGANCANLRYPKAMAELNELSNE